MQGIGPFLDKHETKFFIEFAEFICNFPYRIEVVAEEYDGEVQMIRSYIVTGGFTEVMSGLGKIVAGQFLGVPVNSGVMLQVRSVSESVSALLGLSIASGTSYVHDDHRHVGAVSIWSVGFILCVQ